MTLIEKNLVTLGGQTKRGDVFQTFGYISNTDNKAIVTASGYFNDVKESVTRNDIIQVLDKTSPTADIYFIIITAKPLVGDVESAVLSIGGATGFFLGTFLDPAALQAAYPTASDGNYAEVVSTGTLWVWDADTSAWVDSGATTTVYWQRSPSGDLMPLTDGDNIDIGTGLLKDNDVTAGIALGDSLNTSLNTTNKTIIGGMNELLTLITAESLWDLSGTDVVLQNVLHDVLLRDGEKLYLGTGKDFWLQFNGTLLSLGGVSNGYVNLTMNDTTGFVGLMGGNQGIDSFVIQANNDTEINDSWGYGSQIKLQGSVAGAISVISVAGLTLKDQYLSSAIALSETGEAVLDTVSQSIVGAINEVLATVVGEDFWDRASTTVTLKNAGDDLNLKDGEALALGNAKDLEISYDDPTNAVDFDGSVALDFNVNSYTFGTADNIASAFVIHQGSNNYITIDTTDGSEQINIGENMVMIGDLIFSGSEIFLEATENQYIASVGTRIQIVNDLVGDMQFDAQNGGAWFNVLTGLAVGGATVPVASAMLEVRSTSKGFLPPKMTTTQRDNISSPATGLVIYNTITNQIEFYTGSAWTEPEQLWERTGTVLHTKTADDGVRIDSDAPLYLDDGETKSLKWISSNTRFEFNDLLYVPSLGAGTSGANDGSAIVQVDSTSQGILCPRMTTAQRNAIGTPAEGLQIWNTDTNTPHYYNGSIWIDAGGAGAGDVVGQGASTDNAITRYHLTTGKIIQTSLATIDDTGTINIPSGQTYNINGTPLSNSDIGLGNVTNDAQVKKIGSSTDHAIMRWDGATGDLPQDSLVTIDDAGSINIPSGQTYNINGSPLALNDIANPSASKTFSMGAYKLIWQFTNPAGAMEMNVTGAFTGDVLHIHQHTGNPGATNLLTLEADDADVQCLAITSAKATGFIINKAIQMASDQPLYLDGSSETKFLKWDSASARFEFNDVVRVTNSGTGTSEYGLYAEAIGAATTNYGVFAHATGGTTNYSLYALMDHSGGSNYGLHVADTSSGINSIGVNVASASTSVATTRGFNAVLTSTSISNYGAQLTVSGAGGNNYALHIGATNGTTANWAIYATAGDSYFNDSVVIGTTTLDASAILKIASTTQGLLPPTMTTAQRDAISSPATGLMLYNTDQDKPNYYNGSAWIEEEVFGQDSQTVVSVSRSTTTSATFQVKTTLTTPALTGSYYVRATMITDNDKNPSEYRLRNTTDGANVGGLIDYAAMDTPDRVSGVVEDIITFTGVAKTFQIQWRNVAGGNTAGIANARISVWRVA